MPDDVSRSDDTSRAVVVGQARRSSSSTGLPVVWVPEDLFGRGRGLFQGWVSPEGSHERWHVWVMCSADIELVEIDPEVVRLHRPWACAAVAGSFALDLNLDEVQEVVRLPGHMEDLPAPNVVQVAPKERFRGERWVLAVGPELSAPVRLVEAGHVPDGSARLSYATRVLLGIGPDDTVHFQELAPVMRTKRRRWREAARRVEIATLDAVLGAPAVVLRGTEGLVGDDGRRVVRVDETAMEYIGVEAGQHAVVSWGRRSVVVRVLPQTDITRETMEAQLAQSTGKQMRRSLSRPSSTLEVAPHLRAWIPATVRVELGCPPETVVEMRRSVSRMLRQRASVIAGALVAAAAAPAAFPQVPDVAWAGAGTLLLGSAWATHRRT